MIPAKTSKKLIEVALPLEAINKASVRESFIYRGNPSALHKWWAQRPLAAARAIIYAQMVDDPSAHPDLFPTKQKQEKERQRLFRIIEDLVLWENTTNEEVLERARAEIWQSWRHTCAANAAHPRAKELFDRNKLPTFHDPFAGGGALPLEAQRLGLEAFASDLNPVAVLINKAMIEIPPKFAGMPPANPAARKKSLSTQTWTGAQGLADDIRYYGKWMRDEAEKRIGHLYPKIEITAEMAKDRMDLKPYVGQSLTVIAWLWARTVKSPNPAFRTIDVPLASTFLISTKAGKETYVEPVIENSSYRFIVKTGKPKDTIWAKNGTKAGGRGSSFLCLMSGTPMPFEYLRSEAKAGRMGTRLMAIVAKGAKGRVYLTPTPEQEAIARKAKPEWQPETVLPDRALGFRIQEYGMTRWCDLFTPRQLVALATFSGLVGEAKALVQHDAQIARKIECNSALCDEGGKGIIAYSEAIALYLAFSQDKSAEYGCTIVPWYSKEDRPKGLFARQAIPMVWDFAEVNPLTDIGGSFYASVNIVAGALNGCASNGPQGNVCQADAVCADLGRGSLISTDPPYYDNIGYADLSDFFYCWLRRSMREVFPDLFTTVTVPKAEELVATPYRHDTREKAEHFFLEGMTNVMHRLAKTSHPGFPVTIYYAFKQSESGSESEIVSTGWETFLDAVIRAGFGVTGTWPVRTERGARSVGLGTNALASSIVLVCRPCDPTATVSTRQAFMTELKRELVPALQQLQRGGIAPVDLAQAAIGPGMAVYTRYSKVLDAQGQALTVHEALGLINQVLDEALAEQEGDFDVDTRWALTWFEQAGFAEGEYGMAEQLSKSKNTSVTGMVEAGILESHRGKVRLLRPAELPANWDPDTDTRLTVWEMVHHLVRILETGGESSASAMIAKLGVRAEPARELCYRLYTLCERKKRAQEALAYNGLVQSWPELARLARAIPEVKVPVQGELL